MLMPIQSSNKEIRLIVSSCYVASYLKYSTSFQMFHQTGTEPGKTKLIPGNIQEKGKQYRLKYHIISTFNAAIGNTLSSIVTYLLIINSKFNIWDMVKLM